MCFNFCLYYSSTVDRCAVPRHILAARALWYSTSTFVRHASRGTCDRPRSVADGPALPTPPWQGTHPSAPRAPPPPTPAQCRDTTPAASRPCGSRAACRSCSPRAPDRLRTPRRRAPSPVGTAVPRALQWVARTERRRAAKTAGAWFSPGTTRSWGSGRDPDLLRLRSVRENPPAAVRAAETARAMAIEGGGRRRR